MDTPDEKLVLRSVYLPGQLDSELKTLAFDMDKSKNDVIRDLLAEKVIELKMKKAFQAEAADTKALPKIDWRKVDSGMAAYLSDWMDSQPVEPVVSLFVATTPNLSRYALTILKALGVRVSKKKASIFTASLAPHQIVFLSQRRFIVKLEKSHKLNLI